MYDWILRRSARQQLCHARHHRSSVNPQESGIFAWYITYRSRPKIGDYCHHVMILNYAVGRHVAREKQVTVRCDEKKNQKYPRI